LELSIVASVFAWLGCDAPSIPPCRLDGEIPLADGRADPMRRLSRRSIFLQKSAAGAASSGFVRGDEPLGADEVIAAGMRSQILRRGARILAAARRTEGVYGAAAQTVRVVLEEGARVREFAALSATVAAASSVGGDGQKGR
jgi:hypothetical protein